MKILPQNQSNLLLTPLQFHKLQFISNKLRHSSSSHDQLREQAFSRTDPLIFLNVTLDYS